MAYEVYVEINDEVKNQFRLAMFTFRGVLSYTSAKKHLAKTTLRFQRDTSMVL